MGNEFIDWVEKNLSANEIRYEPRILFFCISDQAIGFSLVVDASDGKAQDLQEDKGAVRLGARKTLSF